VYHFQLPLNPTVQKEKKKRFSRLPVVMDGISSDQKIKQKTKCFFSSSSPLWSLIDSALIDPVRESRRGEPLQSV
jgi:hypothetical protein